MSECSSREAKYVPWSFGEVFECLTCRHRARQSHTLRPLRGAGYAAVFSFPKHERRDLRCMPCECGFHDNCSGPSRCDCAHALVAAPSGVAGTPKDEATK